MRRKVLSLLLSMVLAVGLCPSAAFAGTLAAASSELSTQSVTSYNAKLTFTNNGITETTAGTGYSISGTTLKITAAGTYVVTGSCTEGSIEIAKGLSDVTLVLNDLTLASSSTAPIVVKKDTTANIHLEGTSTLTDNENPANETSSDATVAEAFEGACVKVKSGSSVTFCGDGSLNIVANAKNGIKGGSTAALTFNQSGTISVTGSGAYYGTTTSGAAVNNGIASDGSLTFNQGTYVVKAAGDGIKSTPDATDATEGTTIDTESAGAVTINGGTFDLDVDGDGIQADTTLTIANGTFDIQTWKGYSTWNDTLANANSCKGLKASGDRATEAGTSPTLTVTGGTFTLNCGDDAIHSDAYALITGGTFDIRTGDDGVHADTTFTMGTGGGYERDPDIRINASYEGLEGGTVNIYSGRAYILASDDGVNAADGSQSGTDPRQGGGNSFNPGGGGPGSNGSGWSFGPGGQGGWSMQSVETQATGYSLNMYGGELYVNCDGDGLDSNGTLTLAGGKQTVLSMRGGGDNSPLDAEGTVNVSGATVFAAGGAGMDGTVSTSGFGSQKYYQSSYSGSANQIVAVNQGSTLVHNEKLTKNVNYLLFTSPELTSTPTVATASSLDACKSNSWAHSWNGGTTANGVTTFTCASCGATERQSVAATASVSACAHTAHENSGSESADAGYAVAFAGDAGVKGITVYDRSTYASATTTSLSATGTTVSRNSSTGAADSTGDGQVNFTVVLNDGYELSSVTATDGTYKNIKGPDDTALANTYRITKITGATTVTITTKATTDTSGESSQESSESGDTSKSGSSGNTVVQVPLSACTISATTQTYTGKALTPVKVTYKGATLAKDVDYKVTYSNNVRAGKATAKVTGITKESGTSYTGAKTVTFTIKPAKVTGVKVKSTAAGKAKVTWAKAKAVAAKASGYQIRYKSGSKARIVAVKTASSAKKVLKNLAAGKKVTVKVRAYKNISGAGTVYGAWSKTASVKVKKA